MRGYRLRSEVYELITDGISHALGLRFEPEGSVIGFYRLDTGEKLPDPDELNQAIEQERQRADQERQRAESLESLLARYREQFGELSE